MTDSDAPPTGTADPAEDADDAGAAAGSWDGGAWEGDRVARWLRLAEGLERQLAPVSDVLFASAALQPGERVLDVGCGTGPTTRRAAAEVGPTGRVTGLDVSRDMLDAAASAAADVAGPGWAPLDWVEGDVATADVELPEVDVVLSRFGVMFFAHPVRAFEALAAAAPGGRLVMAVWGSRHRSDLFEVPLAATLDEMDRRGTAVHPPPRDAGPFSLGDEREVRGLLEASGWTGVTWTSHRLSLPLAGGVGAREGAEAAVDFGPTRLVVADLDDSDRAAAVDAIERALEPYVGTDGTIVLGGEVVVVEARPA